MDIASGIRVIQKYSLCAILVGVPFAASLPHATAQNSKVLKARVSATQILDEYGLEVGRSELPAKIVTIRLGTPAADSGLRVGDEIQRFSAEHGTFLVTVKRDQKTYQAELQKPSLDEENSLSSVDGFYVKPSPEKAASERLRVKSISDEKRHLYVDVSISFCTAADNPNWYWLEREYVDPRLGKEWRAWVLRAQSAILRALQSRRSAGTAEERFDYHLSISANPADTIPVVNATPHPDVPVVRAKEAREVRLIPLLNSLGPHFGRFPVGTKAKDIHLRITIKAPCAG